MSANGLLDLIWLIPALPAFGAVVLLLFGKRIGEPKAGWLATAMMAGSFAMSVLTFFALFSLDAEERFHVRTTWTWLKVGGFSVDFGFLADPLSVTMILFVTGVGTLIHMYSIGYMHGDARFSRFFAYLNLFAASMLVLVLGSNFLMTFMGWEGVGLCSYLLISFWFERNSAAVAGKKAFVTNRIGDFGFMIAMFLIFSKLGTLDYAALRGDAAMQLAHSSVTWIALALFLGAMGKSAQVPLHVWLPDAMEGPTPVSALIHAATMVTAGVFLVCRANVFFEASGTASNVVAVVGALTAFSAATVAVKQWDIKRVLAYSTLSQLGYMFMAVGVGAYTAAIFHMVTHAFFKALLFLGSGSVIHGMSDEQDMRRMGALRKLMPVTAGTFIVGWLAICGVFPFAGFWSKDEILAKAWFSDMAFGKVVWAVGLVSAILTAFYMTRQVRLVFFGDARWNDAAATEAHDGTEAEVAAEAVTVSAHAHGADDGHAHHGDHGDHHGGDPHESPVLMLAPLVVLAGLSMVGGFLSLPFTKPNLEFLAHWLEPVFEQAPVIHPTSFLAGAALSLVALIVAGAGIAFGWQLYRDGLAADGSDPVDRYLGAGLSKFLGNAWYFDSGIARLVSGPITTFARTLAEGVDAKVVDGAVNGVGRAVKLGSNGLRRVQSGLVRNYALGIVGGTVALLIWFVTRVSW